MKLSEIIRSYRKNYDLSMDMMAKLCNVSKPYISMLENEKNTKTGEPISPKAETLVKLANGMNISIDELVRMMDGDIVVTFKPKEYSQEEAELIKKFRKLNADGKTALSAQLDIMLQMNKYIANEKNSTISA